MQILASTNNDFFKKWHEVIGHSESIVHVDGIQQLKELLLINTVQLLVLDMALEGGKDPDVLRSVAEVKGAARMILSGMEFSSSTELSGIAVGAVACCSSSLAVKECKQVLDVVCRGGVWLSSTGIPALIEKLRDFSAKTASPASKEKLQEKEEGSKNSLVGLTKREREVAHLVGNGASNKDIARQLDISDRTVKAHLTAIFDKLQVNDRLQLALRVSGNAPQKE